MAQQLAARLGPSREAEHRLRRTLRSLRHGPGVRRLHATERRLPRCLWAVARPGRTTSRRAEQHQRPGAAGEEGAGGSGGHGRASRSTTPSEARVWRSRGRPDPTAPGTLAMPRETQQQAPHQRVRTYKKTDIRIGCRPVVELGGFEPPTFSLRTRRATNCAIAPRTQTA